jgi:hypothetical protein
VSEVLEDVLADEHETAQRMEANGQAALATAIRRICRRVAASAEDYLRFVNEGDAILYSDRSERWLRSHFDEWAEQGHAKKEGATRFYRLIVLPRRANLSAAREAGRRAARNEAAA